METRVLSATSNAAKMSPYLVFRLNGAEYAMHVEHVREIITAVKPSTVPRAPDYLMGVINLRGKILPMIDMRNRFNLPVVEDDGRDCFIVLTLDVDEQTFELECELMLFVRFRELQRIALTISLIFQTIPRTDWRFKVWSRQRPG